MNSQSFVLLLTSHRYSYVFLYLYQTDLHYLQTYQVYALGGQHRLHTLLSIYNEKKDKVAKLEEKKKKLMDQEGASVTDIADATKAIQVATDDKNSVKWWGFIVYDKGECILYLTTCKCNVCLQINVRQTMESWPKSFPPMNASTIMLRQHKNSSPT